MDKEKFDAIAKAAAISTSRRTALGAAAALAGVTFVGRSGRAAQEATPVPDAEQDFPEFLFVQTFASGTWQPADGESLYLLTLSGATAQTVYFSDRPERIVGLVPTEQFFEGLGFTPANPPNAALVAQRSDVEGEEVLVIELFDPVFDAETSALTYTARVLEDYDAPGLATLAASQTDHEFPESFAGGSLFIDGCSDGHAVCYYVQGGEKIIAGNISSVGCCWDTGAGNCEVCNDDANSSYYGKLCNEAYPDQCSYGLTQQGLEWSCYVDEGSCPSFG